MDQLYHHVKIRTVDCVTDKDACMECLSQLWMLWIQEAIWTVIPTAKQCYLFDKELMHRLLSEKKKNRSAVSR